MNSVISKNFQRTGQISISDESLELEELQEQTEDTGSFDGSNDDEAAPKTSPKRPKS